MSRLLTRALPLLCAMLALPAVAASGTALDVDPDAHIEAQSGTRTLVVGTDVFIGDRINTDARGLVQIRFTDRTELTIGPNSSLLIEDYLLREDESNGKFAINMLSGTFRFVTGRGAKDSYEISTPTGTIGIRGTAFDTNVHPDHASLLLYQGTVVMCNSAGQCVTVEGTCDVGMFDTTEAALLGNGNDFTGEDRTSMRAMFPWAVDESALRGDFRINDARACLNRTPEIIEREERDDPEPQNRDNISQP